MQCSICGDWITRPTKELDFCLDLCDMCELEMEDEDNE